MSHTLTRGELADYVPPITGGVVRACDGHPLWSHVVDGVDEILSDLSARELVSGANQNYSQRSHGERITVDHYRAYAATLTSPDRLVIEHRDASVSVYTR